MSLLPPIYELGPDFYDEVDAARFPTPILRYRNQEAAQTLDLAQLSSTEWIEHFGQFQPLPGNISRPLALRYHGHQFTHYNPDLGDGRGFLWAQFQTPQKLYDLGTKGSGQTPYSRNGDGRLTLKGAFREILATELLQSYGVNTSRTFSVIETGETLERHDEPSPTRAAVLVRLCHSHIRFGTFQRLAFLQQDANICKLTEYCLRHYYPEVSFSDPAERATAFFQKVTSRSIDLVASWMMVGFVHGVMNTDNMNITGECFDYGPYRFLPSYNPDFTAAYFDHQGLYSFGRQPITMLWNLEQLGKSLQQAYPRLPVAEILENFGDEFNLRIQKHFLRRLNLRLNASSSPQSPQTLLSAFFQFLETTQAAYEQTFFDLFGGVNEGRLLHSPQTSLYTNPSFEPLRRALQAFSPADALKLQHPYFAEPNPCSLLIDELEQIWSAVAQSDDWSAFERKLNKIRSLRGLY